MHYRHLKYTYVISTKVEFPFTLFLATCIELAKADIEDIKKMIAREKEEGRLSNFHDTKTEIERMTQSEKYDMKEWLKNCNNDLKILGKKVHSYYYRESENIYIEMLCIKMLLLMRIGKTFTELLLNLHGMKW